METSPPISETLRVTDGGLRAEASWCESLAGQLVGSAPVASGSAVLASAAAVNTANALVGAAGARCMTRMQETATALSAAANGYTQNEGVSAAMMRAVAPTRLC